MSKTTFSPHVRVNSDPLLQGVLDCMSFKYLFRIVNCGPLSLLVEPR